VKLLLLGLVTLAACATTPTEPTSPPRLVHFALAPVQGLNRLDLTPTPLSKEGLSLTEKFPGVGDHAPHPE
jgi:hypothetical protein